MTSRIARRLGACAAVFAVLAIAGCGGESTATVSGTVTFQGKPLPSGTVTFIGKDNKVATGGIEPNGRYSISGIPVGQVTITVSTPTAAAMPVAKGATPDTPLPKIETVSIPAKYGNPAESGLTYTVTPGTQEHNIELK